MIRCGLQRDGIQRIACWPCGVRLQVSYSRVTAKKRGAYQLAAFLLGQGKSIREVESLAGISKKTVMDIRRSVFQNTEVLCGCGQEAGHNGWCSYRYDRSPARQATMTRMGRPPKQINIEVVKLLRAQGMPVREIAARFKVNRNTINRKLAQDRAQGRMLPWFCIGTLNVRTALAAKRYEIIHNPIPSGESFQKAMNELWHAARSAGCPSCGAVRKYASGECRRCITLRLKIQRIGADILGAIHSYIGAAQQPLREFLDSVSDKRGLSSNQRLMLLLQKINDRPTTITTEG